MAPTHDPLTEEHLAFLNSLPVEMTVQEQATGPNASTISFLQRIGLTTVEDVHISADTSKSIYRHVRTAKPLPGAS